VPRGTSPNANVEGASEPTLTAFAVNVSAPILMQLPPTSGHSKASKCAVFAPSAEALKVSLIVQAASLLALQALVSRVHGGDNAPSALERLYSE